MLLLGGCSSKSNTEIQQENTIVKEQEGAPTESKTCNNFSVFVTK